MSYGILPNGKQQFIDSNGNPLAGGKVYYYIPSTTTFKNTYQDDAGSSLNTNPVVLDASGQCIAYGTGSYRQQVFDVNGNLIWDQQVDTPLTGASTISSALVTYNEGGTGAVTTTVQAKLRESVSVLDFGADPTGVADSAPAFQAAIAASLSIYIPPGTYTIGTTGSTGALLYLGINTGNPSRNGMHIYGAGVGNTTLKLANGVGSTALMFGAGNTDSLANMTFNDFTIDLNGTNNNINSIYNNAFYLYCPCNNMTWEHIYFKNMASQQTIRVGNETSAGYGNNIIVKNCTFDTFGIGGGYSTTDISVLYLQANNIKVVNNTFTNPSFTFNLAIGHTAIEFNGDNSTIIEGNYFNYVQLPTLIDSIYKNNTNIQIINNNYNQCNYLCSFDSGSTYDQKKINISNNIYQSTVVSSSSIIAIASGTDASKTREDIVVNNNIINCFGNTNQYVNVFYFTSQYIRSLTIQNNDISRMNGALLYIEGIAETNNYEDFIIRNNRLDSLGATGGANFPSTPVFIMFATSTGNINSVSISNNYVLNTATKNYSALGVFNFSGNINFLNVYGNYGTVSSSYKYVIDTSVNSGAKYIDQYFLNGPFNFSNVVITPPSSVTPNVNGQVTFQLTSNTQLTFVAKGSDGTVRTGSITLS